MLAFLLCENAFDVCEFTETTSRMMMESKNNVRHRLSARRVDVAPTAEGFRKRAVFFLISKNDE